MGHGTSYIRACLTVIYLHVRSVAAREMSGAQFGKGGDTMQSSNRGPNQQELEEFFAQAGNNVLRMLFGRGTVLLILAFVVLVIIWLGSGSMSSSQERKG